MVRGEIGSGQRSDVEDWMLEIGFSSTDLMMIPLVGVDAVVVALPWYDEEGGGLSVKQN